MPDGQLRLSGWKKPIIASGVIPVKSSMTIPEYSETDSLLFVVARAITLLPESLADLSPLNESSKMYVSSGAVPHTSIPSR